MPGGGVKELAHPGNLNALENRGVPRTPLIAGPFAGISAYGYACDAADCRAVFDVDPTAAFISAKAVIPGMIKNGCGKIITMRRPRQPGGEAWKTLRDPQSFSPASDTGRA